MTAAAPLVFAARTYEFSYLPKAAFIQIGVLVLLSAWALAGSIDSGIRVLKSRLNLSVFAFLTWGALSVLWAHNRIEATAVWLHWASCAAVFFLSQHLLAGKTARSRLLLFLYVSALICAVIGVVQFLFDFSGIPQAVPPASTFANRNMAVHFIVLCLPLGIALFLNSRRPLLDGCLCLSMAVMTAYLFYARTRAGWLAFAAEVLILAPLLFFERRRWTERPQWNRHKSIAAGVGLIVAVGMIGTGQSGIGSGFSEIADRARQGAAVEMDLREVGMEGGSIAWRMGSWLNTLEMCKDAPLLGRGLANHKIFYPLYHRARVDVQSFTVQSQLIHVHNDPLQVLAELGVIGFILLLSTWGLLAKTAHGVIAGSADPENRAMAIGIAAGLFGISVNALFSFPFQRAIPPFVVMLLAGALLAAAKEPFGEGAFVRIRSRRVTAVLAAVLLAGAAAMVHYHYHRLRNDRIFYNITGYDRAGNWRKVVSAGETAKGNNIERYRIFAFMGRAYIELRQNRKAAEVLSSAVKIYPNVINYLYHLGMAYGNLGRMEDALQSFQRAVRIKPGFALAHENIGKIFKSRKQWPEAMAAFERASNLTPDRADLHFETGIAAVRTEDHEKAAAAFAEAVARSPGWALAHKNLGVAYYLYLNRRREGVGHLKKALELDPNIQEADNIRALIRRWEAGRK